MDVTTTKLAGNRSRAGLFAERCRFPDGYTGRPHTHSVDFHVLVLSGELRLEFGDGHATTRVETFGPGGFVVVPAGAVHAESFRGETIVHVAGVGPVETTYSSAPASQRER